MVIRQLIYLIALAREQHFARAAKSCNVTQPTLSASIRQLEQELNVLIVERAHRFKGFTPEGEIVLQWAKKILADRDSLHQDLSLLQTGMIGHMRFGAIPSALPLVPLLTSPFVRKHPLVTVSVFSMASDHISSALENFEIDLGLTYLDNEPLTGQVRSYPLYKEEYILLVPAGSPHAGRATISWAEAAELQLCLLTPNMQNRRIIDGVFRSVGRVPSPAVETNSIVNLCAHVRTGPWSSVVTRGLLFIFGIPEGTRAIRLVEPEVKKSIGLVMADRDPPPPLARGMLREVESIDIDAELARVDLGA